MSKWILLVSLASVGSVASAVAHGPGWVKRAYCSPAAGEGRAGGETVTEICTATVNGKRAKYIVAETVQRAGRRTLIRNSVWRITSETGNSRLAVVKIQKAGYIGDDGKLDIIRNVRAEVGEIEINKNFEGKPVKMSGDVEGLRFTAEDFRGQVHAL